MAEECQTYRDEDGDGLGTGDDTAGCPAPAGYVPEDGDCDDGVASIHPTAEEQCDGVDQDCDGTFDEGLEQEVFWRDADGDRAGGSETQVMACAAPEGFVASSDDCDDDAAMVTPGAEETCDGVDQDCDGSVDEGLSAPLGEPVILDEVEVAPVGVRITSIPAGYAVVWSPPEERTVLLRRIGTDGEPIGEAVEVASTDLEDGLGQPAIALSGPEDDRTLVVAWTTGDGALWTRAIPLAGEPTDALQLVPPSDLAQFRTRLMPFGDDVVAVWVESDTSDSEAAERVRMQLLDGRDGGPVGDRRTVELFMGSMFLSVPIAAATTEEGLLVMAADAVYHSSTNSITTSLKSVRAPVDPDGVGEPSPVLPSEEELLIARLGTLPSGMTWATIGTAVDGDNVTRAFAVAADGSLSEPLWDVPGTTLEVDRNHTLHLGSGFFDASTVEVLTHVEGGDPRKVTLAEDTQIIAGSLAAREGADLGVVYATTGDSPEVRFQRLGCE